MIVCTRCGPTLAVLRDVRIYAIYSIHCVPIYRVNGHSMLHSQTIAHISSDTENGGRGSVFHKFSKPLQSCHQLLIAHLLLLLLALGLWRRKCRYLLEGMVHHSRLGC